MSFKYWKTRFLPEVYKTSRPLSDDWAIPFLPLWIQPWTRIPRWWRFWPLPFPPRFWSGTQTESFFDLQEGYPLAPDAEILEVSGQGRKIKSIAPVGWGWSIQSVWISGLGRVPCYFQWTRKFLGRKLHFNAGLRPDITVNDWGWWFPEASIGWTRE